VVLREGKRGGRTSRALAGPWWVRDAPRMPPSGARRSVPNVFSPPLPLLLDLSHWKALCQVGLLQILTGIAACPGVGTGLKAGAAVVPRSGTK